MYQRMVQLNLPKAQSIDIEFRNVRYEVSSKYFGTTKQILKGVSGSFRSGELTAIMGPSGAGKSTLLNILTGFKRGSYEGTIEYGGNHGKHTWTEYRKESCYIQQEDQLDPLFTTLEIMRIATNLKIGGSLNRKAKEMLIDDILDSLDLVKVKDTRCNRLSGGQKKRLSIALELIDNPPVMFLDEPTTGLDALSSLQCVSVLQNLAKSGRTIVCTIHQPSAVVYEMFDLVYLLADGRCMYEGSAKNTVAYFADVGLNCPQYHNPADYMIEVVCGEYGDFVDQLEAVAQAPEAPWRSIRSGKVPMFGKQLTKRALDELKTTVLITPPPEIDKFWVLMHRCVLHLSRDWTTTHLRLALHALVGVLLGLFYTDSGSDGAKTINNVGYFLVSAVYLCYTSMMPAVLKFPSEMHTLRKERFNNWYKLKTYYIASLLCNLPMQMLFAVTYASLSYLLSSQPLESDRFLMFLSIALLTSIGAESFGLVVGTVFDPVNGTFIGAIATCIMLLFSGFLALFNHMPRLLYFVAYGSYLKYAVHGFVQAVYGFNRERLTCTKTYCHYRTPQLMMKEFSMDEGKYWTDIVILVCNVVLLRIVAYFMLKKKLSQA